MTTQGNALVLTPEDKQQLSSLAFQTWLRLTRKRQPLSAEEQKELRFVNTLTEACKQIPG
jgi:hypothetical protein